MNIDAGNSREYATFFSVIVNSILAYAFLYTMWQLYMDHLRAHSKTLELRSFTVMIRNFPHNITDKKLLREYFELLRPSSVSSVNINLDLSGLNKFQSKATDLLRSLERLKALKENARSGKAAYWWCKRRSEEELENKIILVENEMHRLRQKIEEWSEEEKTNTGIAFVTFRTLQVAQNIVHKAHKSGEKPKEVHVYDEANLTLPDTPLTSSFPSFSRSNSLIDLETQDLRQKRLTHLRSLLRTRQWRVEEAPDPADVLHDHVGRPWWKFLVKTLFINLFLFVLLFFFTTPISIFGSFSNVFKYEDILTSLSQAIFKTFKFLGDSTLVYGYIASFLLMICTLIVPRLMTAVTKLQGHETVSKRERSTMRKIFAYLVLALVVMPSIFITSLDALWKYTLGLHSPLYTKIYYFIILKKKKLNREGRL